MEAGWVHYRVNCLYVKLINIAAPESLISSQAGGSIEERFLSTRADAFARSEREEKASARCARNDRRLAGLGNGRCVDGHEVFPSERADCSPPSPRPHQRRNSAFIAQGCSMAQTTSLREPTRSSFEAQGKPTRSHEANAGKRRRLAPLGMTVVWRDLEMGDVSTDTRCFRASAPTARRPRRGRTKAAVNRRSS